MRNEKARVNPRISVNKLAEYMRATPARRRGIIRDQKQPREIVVARYQDVYAAIADCLLNANDLAPVHERLETLYMATPKTTWEAQDKQLSADALESFLTFVDEIDLSGFDVAKAPENLPLMTISGVGVSVKPAVLLRIPGTSQVVGAVHVYVSKLFAFEQEAAAYAGTILHQYLDAVLSQGRADSARCFVIDVFKQEVYCSPRSYKKRRRDIEAACEEIAQRWSAV